MAQVSQILPFVFHSIKYKPFISAWMTVLSAETNGYSKLGVRNISRHWRTCTFSSSIAVTLLLLHCSCTRLPVCVNRECKKHQGDQGVIY